MKWLRRLSARLRLANNRRRSMISVEFRRWVPRLRVNEKHEGRVKWTLRIITGLGIVTGAIAFPWYAGLLIAAGLAGTEQVLERAVFLYTTLYVQPMPHFDYDPDEWLGMVFGEPADRGGLYVVAPIFRTEAYAHEFFSLIRAWNYDENEDHDNNVCMSFIIEDAKKYSVYLYPNIKRRSISDFARAIEEEALVTKPGKEHFQLFMQFMLCKMLDYSPESHFERFRRRQDPGRPFWLAAAVQRGAEGHILPDPGPILKFHWKIKERSELDGHDMEYEHGKVVIGLD